MLTHVPGTFDQALNLHEQGQLSQAITLYEQIVAANPRHSGALHSLGVAALQLGNTELAIERFRSAIRMDPTLHMAYANMGNALVLEGRFIEALPYYDRALQLRPDFTGALFNRANALMELQRYVEALACYENVLAVEPDSIVALNNRGQALLQLRRSDEALLSFDRALSLAPDYCPALNNRANALLELRRAPEALTSCDRALALEPDYAEAHYNRGNALLDMKRHDEALDSFEQALRYKPDYVEALSNRAATLLEMRRSTEALLSCEQALALQPDDAETFNTQGAALLALGRPGQALQSFDQALSLRPDFSDALNNRADALQHLGRHPEAAATFSKLQETAQGYDYVPGRRLHAQLHCCDWSGYAEAVEVLSQSIAAGGRVDLPFSSLSVLDSPHLLLRCARTFIADKHPPATPLWTGQRYQHRRIRLAYLSADFRDHPVAYLMAELLEHHDRTRFEIMGLSLQAEAAPSAIAQRMRNACEQYFDVTERSDQDVATLLNSLQVDIAMDLTGLTTGSRPGILAFRPAPVQVNYLGFPGTMGADRIDYLIADPVTVPESLEAAYAEHIVRLPHTFFPAGNARMTGLEQPARSAAGLPEQGFVFCAFHSAYKISPAVFRVWMELLRSVPGSVLWLRDITPEVTSNLRREAAANGVDGERLIFAPKVADREQHLARQMLADLFLDTSPYGAHSTACDSLSIGLPVLTCMGNTFAGRVTASLLQAAGLPELITHNLSDYATLALQLATQPQLLTDIRNKLNNNRSSQSLFDIERYCRDLELAYVAMWQRHQAGQSPTSFSVAKH